MELELFIWILITGIFLLSTAFDGGVLLLTGSTGVIGFIFLIVLLAALGIPISEDLHLQLTGAFLEVIEMILKWLFLHKGGIITELIWIWTILGSAFLVMEIFRKTLVFASLGLSAALLAGLLILIPFNLGFQIFFFVVGSLIIMSFLHVDYKSKMKLARLGQKGSKEKLGQITEIWGDNKFTVTFDMIVMGSQSWMAHSDEPLVIGDIVKVVSIEGNNLRVKKIKEQILEEK